MPRFRSTAGHRSAIRTATLAVNNTFHRLRYAITTTAIASGGTVQTVSSLLGHANPQITLTTYANE